MGASHCGERGAVDGAELGMSLGSGWSQSCSVTSMHDFYTFPITYVHFTGLQSSFLAIGMDNHTGGSPTENGEQLLRGLFQ